MLKNISAPAFGLPVFFTGNKKSERLTKEDEQIGENDKAKNVCKGKYLQTQYELSCNTENN